MPTLLHDQSPVPSTCRRNCQECAFDRDPTTIDVRRCGVLPPIGWLETKQESMCNSHLTLIISSARVLPRLKMPTSGLSSSIINRGSSKTSQTASKTRKGLTPIGNLARLCRGRHSSCETLAPGVLDPAPALRCSTFIELRGKPTALATARSRSTPL